MKNRILNAAGGRGGGMTRLKPPKEVFEFFKNVVSEIEQEIVEKRKELIRLDRRYKRLLNEKEIFQEVVDRYQEPTPNA